MRLLLTDARALDDLADQVLMAAVESVEVADGDDGGQGRDHAAQLAHPV